VGRVSAGEQENGISGLTSRVNKSSCRHQASLRMSASPASLPENASFEFLAILSGAITGRKVEARKTKPFTGVYARLSSFLDWRRLHCGSGKESRSQQDRKLIGDASNYKKQPS